MPTRDESFYREHTQAIIDKLMRAGWIDRSGFHDEKEQFNFRWTPKGLERSKWVKEIAAELHLGPEGMTALMVICELHANP